MRVTRESGFNHCPICGRYPELNMYSLFTAEVLCEGTKLNPHKYLGTLANHNIDGDLVSSLRRSWNKICKEQS